MDIEFQIALATLAILSLSFINFMYLRSSFTRIVANSDNIKSVKRHKRKWSFMLFTDVILYLALSFVLLLGKISAASIIGLIITFIYLEMIRRMMIRSGDEISGSSSLENDACKNDNVIINSNSNEPLISSNDFRRLIINRIKVYYARLLKIHIFIDSDDLSDGCFRITLNGDQYRQIGSMAYGKTLTVNVPNRSVKMLVCTFIPFTSPRLPINIKRFTISSGNKDVVLNIKPVPPNSSAVTSGVSFIVEQETK